MSGTSTETSAWADYGFPQTEFLPCLIPMRGLYLALRERRDCVLPPPVNQLKEPIPECRPELLSVFPSGQAVSRDFDTEFADIARRFINHVKTDFTDLREIPYWTLPELAEALDEELIDPVCGKLQPEFYSGWLSQRYRMINLLKLAPIDYEVAQISGSEHTGIPSTPNAAIRAALEKCGDPGRWRNGSIQRMTESIWGPDHGWRYGSYCANVSQSGEVVALSSGEVEKTEMRLYLSIDSPSADPKDFDSYGTGVQLGLNVYYADPDGTFLDWTLPAEPDRQHWPTEGKTTTYGFTARQVLCVGDYSSIFQFSDEV